jgi:hypothetical protein
LRITLRGFDAGRTEPQASGLCFPEPWLKLFFRMNFPLWLIAGWWGFFAGAALIVGALAGYALRIPQRLIAAIMAFGSGVLISALSFDLMDEAYKRGGFDSTAIGFMAAPPFTRRPIGTSIAAAQSIANARASSSLTKVKIRAAALRLRSARFSMAFRNRS